MRRLHARLPLLRKDLPADVTLAARHLFDLARLYGRKPNNELVYYNLLFSIAMAANASLILELGTGPGVSSLAFVRALQYYRQCKLNTGVLHTCDLDASTIAQLRRVVAFGELVIPHHMSTDELALAWARTPRPVDLLYIDAYHTFEQSLRDFESFAPHVAPNGLVLMHDTFPLTEQHESIEYSGTVWQTPQYIKANFATDYEVMTLPFLCGICLLRKRGAKYF